MKLFKNAAMVIAFALSVFIASCGGGPIEHVTEYVVQCPTGTSSADMNSVYAVMQKRLDNFGLEGDYELSLNVNRINVRVRENAVNDESRMRDLLQRSAKVTFRSMYNFGEIASTMNVAQQTYLRLNHIDSLNPDGAGFSSLIAASYNEPSSPLIFACRAKDTSAVMNILRTDSIAVLFNSDVVFRWGAGLPIGNGERTYGLFACKEGYNYVMSGNYIESAVVQSNSNTVSNEISLKFDPVGSMEFARITKANVGHSLAIELDGFVYSYPLVTAEVTGGSAMISGDFSRAEIDDLARILNAGTLPVAVALIEENTF
jgi:SecD/SecF fusion protein